MKKLILILLILSISNLNAQNAQIEACKDKKKGDSCNYPPSITSNARIYGICRHENIGGPLVCKSKEG